MQHVVKPPSPGLGPGLFFDPAAEKRKSVIFVTLRRLAKTGPSDY